MKMKLIYKCKECAYEKTIETDTNYRKVPIVVCPNCNLELRPQDNEKWVKSNN